MERLARKYRYLSRPVEELIRGHECESGAPESPPIPDQIAGSGYIHCPTSEPGIATCDVLIVGSGYGGAIAASVLAGVEVPGQNRPLRVIMLERGKEFAPGEFPESLGDLPGEVRFHRDTDDEFTGDADALFDFRINKDVTALVGNGLGGGSLINGNVALKPDSAIFNNGRWPKELRSADALREHFDAVETLLGVETPAKGWLPTKYDALRILANSVGSISKPAPLTVDLNACTKCGNCVTGCNVGAKKTLPLTVLPEAIEKGLEIYTGASVLSVQRCPDDQAWAIRFRRTATAKNILKHEIFQIRAKIVILAAGTLGSTEILLRSKANNAVSCSDRLGERFSTNGDMIAFGYAGASPVRATGKSSLDEHKDPGPTITGYASLSFFGSNKPPVTVQDAAVPLALKQVFEELVTTASLLARYVKRDAPEWFKKGKGKNQDPLIVHPDAIENTQVILAMGHDQAMGRIDLSDSKNLDDRHALIKWKKAAKDPVFNSLHWKFIEAYLKRGLFLKDRYTLLEGGFDGGDYLPSPAWKAVPDGFEQAVTGGAPAGKLLTVHPLGGCVMADSAAKGVVNHLGQVFKGNGGEDSYRDLYVLDGAILPGPLGINPFMTISAIAHRNSQEIRKFVEAGTFSFDESVQPCVTKCAKTTTYNTGAEKAYAIKALDAKPITIEFREQLARYPDRVPLLSPEQYDKLIEKANAFLAKQFQASAPRALGDPPKEFKFYSCKYYRLVIEVRATIDIDRFLCNPDETINVGEVELYLDPSHSVDACGPPAAVSVEVQNNRNQSSLFVEPIRKEHLIPIAKGQCQVRLMVRDNLVQFGEPSKRFWKVAHAAGRRRKQDFAWGELFKRPNELALTTRQHTFWRKLKYDLEFTCGDLVDVFGSLTVTGEKALGYSLEHENPWDALIRINMTFRSANGRQDSSQFQVDLNHLLKDGIPQVIESPHMPATIMGMARLGLFALRAMLQTHLWSFRAPTYTEHKPLKPLLPQAIKLASRKPCKFDCIHLHHIDLDKPAGKPPVTKPYVRLARYELEESSEKPDREKKHLLLIHGLAHGGAVFTTDTIKQPMAGYFVEQGYVVWVLDHRLSPALEWRPHRRPVTMDHLAEVDIPLAVNHVYEKAGVPIHVFAHCVGAGAFAMAALSGKLKDDKKNPQVKRATIHAVTPWLIASPKNQVTAKIAAFYKDTLKFDDPEDEGFDPIPPFETATSKAAFSDALLDRFAGSFPWNAEESPHHERGHSDIHMSKTVCDRMRLLYGQQWNHANLCDATHEKIGRLVGFCNLEVLRHIYFCVLRERLTDRYGNNTYLDFDKIKANWTFDTMFIHGADNQVFSPLSSRVSAWKLNKTTQVMKGDDAHYQKPTIWRCDIAGYGHMDMLFGKNAAQHVYPRVREFFEEKLVASDPTDSIAFGDPIGKTIVDKDPKKTGSHSGLPPTDPRVGPVLFKPKVVDLDFGEVRLDVWLEPTNNATSPPLTAKYEIGELRDRKTIACRENEFPTEIESKYNYGKYWIDGLKFPCDPLRIDPVVIYTHKDVPLVFGCEKVVCHKSGRPLPWLQKLKNKDWPLAFALGSCRYPGSPFEREASDRIFAAILKQSEVDDAANALDCALFVGDQIYADATANAFDTTELAERYWERYREAFKSDNMKALLARLPTYFALDDHEFDDDWLGRGTLDPKEGDPNADRYRHALDAARSYLGMAGYEKGAYKFWYDFNTRCYPFFVMDTRTCRTLRHAGITASQALIADESQWEKLTKWLSDYKTHPGPKFIACGSPLAPPLKRTLEHRELWRNDDSWLGFPGSLAKLVGYIVEKEIQNVVLLGGDLHLSAYAAMKFKVKGKDDILVHQIVASGLYAPLPFANTMPADLGSGLYPIPGSEHQIEFFESKILSTSLSHFIRVEVRRSSSGSNFEVVAQAYDPANTAVGDPPARFNVG